MVVVGVGVVLVVVLVDFVTLTVCVVAAELFVGLLPNARVDDFVFCVVRMGAGAGVELLVAGPTTLAIRS